MSRKFFAFIVWSILLLVAMILQPEFNEKTIEWYRDNKAWWQKQLWMREIPIISASGKRELH